MSESSWARQAYCEQEEMSPYIGSERRLIYEGLNNLDNKNSTEIKEKLTLGKKQTLRQKLAKIFGAIEVKPLAKPDKYAEARERKFVAWLQKAIDENQPIEWIERLFITQSNKDLKQLKDALLFLSENVAVKEEIGYGETMKSFVVTINKIEDLLKERKTSADESESLRRAIIKEIISLPEENGLRRQVIELTGVLSSL